MKRRISFRSSKTVEKATPSRSAGRWPPADRALASRGAWDWLAFPHQSRIWPEVLRAARPALLAGLVLIALGVSAAVVFLPSERETPERGAGDEAEIRLLADATSPNLNSTSAVAPEPEPAPLTELVPTSPTPLPVPPPVAMPRVEAAPAPMIAPAPAPREPAPLEPIAAEPPRPLEAGVSIVIIPANAPALESDVIDIRASHPGDTPMIREWKMLGLQTVLAGALVAATTGIAPAEADKNDKGSTDVKKDDVSDQLKVLQGLIKGLTESVDKLGKGSDVKKDDVSEQLKKIQADINRLLGEVLDSKLKADKASTGVETLTADVERLRKELEALRTQVAAGRISNYPQAQSGTGRIKIVNTFTTPITLVVNNKVYRDVMPGETRLTDALPAGTINYEVLGIQSARNTHLDANEVLTINVFVRQ